MRLLKFTFLFLISSIMVYSCKREKPIKDLENRDPIPFNFIIPAGMPPMFIPADNPLTVEGVALGRKLFYDPVLSANNTLSCAGCHRQNFAFADSTLQFSVGITGATGTRNAPALFNLGWEKKFFWDGGAATLEDQVIGPITNPIEMHDTLTKVIAKLQKHSLYPPMFKKAFGSDSITTKLIMKAIAQFERTLISANSKYDEYKQGKIKLDEQEWNGMQLFIGEKGDCNHCHVLGSTFTDFEFRNNGLDSVFADEGRYRITLNPDDMGKFKTPTLRNIALTAPYMHDGRFKTLKEVINFYNSDFHLTATLDPNIALQKRGRLNPIEINDLIAFLNTLTDKDFVSNVNFSKP